MQIDNKKINDFFNDMKNTGKNLVKSQLILSSITLILLTVGLTILDIKHSFLIAVGITIVDILPVVGSGIVMLPWAGYYMLFGDNMNLGIKIAVLYIILTVVREILEPIVRGKNLGLTPLMTAVSCILGFIFFNAIGLIIGPVIAIIGQSIYKIFMKKDKTVDWRE